MPDIKQLSEQGHKMNSERELFEEYYKPRMWSLKGDSIGYFDQETNAMWLGWQARATIQPSQQEAVAIFENKPVEE